MPTLQDLADDLESMEKPELEDLIREIRDDEFHDFKNSKYALPKMALVRKLKEHGLHNKASDVKRGHYSEREED